MALLVLGIVGLLVGIWFGLPGRYEQTPDDIERLMERGGGTRRRRAKREISPLAWLQRKLSASGPPKPTRRRGFKLEAPEERKPR
ncbi:MAG: hypothetical protein OEM67_10090 [Thermoleophilia bacterium]|nr:hypothetical protein [Thermoleophilia bacterium]